jgi:hypothetical protein
MFTERRSKRRNSIRIERNAASFSRLGCAVIEPRDFACKIYPIPFESKDLTRSTPSRQSESYDWPHVRRHGVKQSLRFLVPKKPYATPRFLKHPNFWHRTDPTPILVRKIQDSANYLEGTVDSCVSHLVVFFSIADEWLQRGHIDGIQPLHIQVQPELLQVIAVIRHTFLLAFFEVTYDGLSPYERTVALMIALLGRRALQMSDKSFSLRAIDTMRALTYAPPVWKEETHPPVS